MSTHQNQNHVKLNNSEIYGTFLINWQVSVMKNKLSVNSPIAALNNLMQIIISTLEFAYFLFRCRTWRKTSGREKIRSITSCPLPQRCFRCVIYLVGITIMKQMLWDSTC